MTGCTPVLVPAAGAVRVPGDGDCAYGEVAGVRVWACGNAWDGAPGNLADLLTPVFVTLENRSGQKLRLTEEDFALSGSSGMRYAALPPYPGDLRSEAPMGPSVVLADYHPAVPPSAAPPRHRPGPPSRFWVVRPRVHVGVPVWPLPWLWWNAAWHQRYSAAWPAPLPSQDVVRRALPDGVLDEQGVVSGFLYFQQVSGREAVVNLELALHDAETGTGFGTVRIPFRVRR